MAWFRKPKTPLQAADKRDIPADVWDKCPSCSKILYRQKLQENWNVCPECAFHLRLPAPDYIKLLLDSGSFLERNVDLRSGDPLGFVDQKPYIDRLRDAERKTGRGDAVITGEGKLETIPVSLAVMDFAFIGGSMGSVVGEKIARIGLRALDARTPLIIISASGGARMMEGIFSLMQMAKTSAVLAQLHEAGLPYISVLTDPTTGGVTASYSMLGDVNLAEPGSLIGFAGPRVIEQTIKQTLPEGFQRAEFLLEHGMLDRIVDRREMKAGIARLLRHMLGLPEPEVVSAEIEAAAG
ncbi:MAG: acetyl-CoA carboxylase carboxyltransferase subunit beta [Gemmatimonadetes bacterium]|jgi:acetyl-CoA carboxylase carboxyl transferase subunit beta|nr:acetyl-CoA carboxylase carboxyltransferase subunit beta [Gemmatimonadota bacterium]